MELLVDPIILAMDEPTSGLDATGTLDLIEWLSEFTQNGNSVVVTIHQPRSEVFHMFQRVLLMKDGHIVGLGEPSSMVTLASKWQTTAAGLIVEKPTKSNPADFILDEMQQASDWMVKSSFSAIGMRRNVEQAIAMGCRRMRMARFEQTHPFFSSSSATAVVASTTPRAVSQATSTVTTPRTPQQASDEPLLSSRTSTPTSPSFAFSQTLAEPSVQFSTSGPSRPSTLQSGRTTAELIDVDTGMSVASAQNSLHKTKRYEKHRCAKTDLELHTGTTVTPLYMEHASTSPASWVFSLLVLISRYQRETARQLRTNLSIQLVLSMVYMSWLYYNASPAFVLGSTHFTIMYTFPMLINFTFSASLIKTFEAFRLEKKSKIVTASQVVCATFLYLTAVAIPLTGVTVVIIYAFSYGGNVHVLRILLLSVLQMEVLGISVCWMCAMAGMAYHFCLANDFMLTMYSAFIGMAGVFSGYFVGPAAAPPPQEAFYYLSPLFYAFASLARVSQDGVPSGCQSVSGILPTASCLLGSPQLYLKQFGFAEVPVGLFQLAIFGFMVLFLATALLFLLLSGLAKVVPKARSKVQSTRLPVRAFQPSPLSHDRSQGNSQAPSAAANTTAAAAATTPTTAAATTAPKTCGPSMKAGTVSSGASQSAQAVAATPAIRADMVGKDDDNSCLDRFVLYVLHREAAQEMLEAQRRHKRQQAERKLLEAYVKVTKGRQPSSSFMLWVLKHCYDDVYAEHTALERWKRATRKVLHRLRQEKKRKTGISTIYV